MCKKRKYRGKIFSGIGVARTRVAENLELYEMKSGMQFYPGTLNIKLSEMFELPEDNIHIPAEEIKTSGRKSDISLVPARLLGERVFLLYPHNPMYERDVMEIMGSFNIRDRFNLNDGDEIEIIPMGIGEFKIRKLKK